MRAQCKSPGLPAVLLAAGLALVGRAGIGPAADGTIRLAARAAEIMGTGARLEEVDEEPNIGFWDNQQTWVRWSASVARPGRYRVDLQYALEPGFVGGSFELIAAGQTLHAAPAATEGWRDYVTVTLGELQLPAAGEYEVAVKPVRIVNSGLMNLRAVVLVPLPPMQVLATLPRSGRAPEWTTCYAETTHTTRVRRKGEPA